jgi:hypothetical protein
MRVIGQAPPEHRQRIATACLRAMQSGADTVKLMQVAQQTAAELQQKEPSPHEHTQGN